MTERRETGRTIQRPPRRQKPVSVAPSASAGTEGERIAKYLASAGVASRRDVEKLIAEGRVTVDGATLDTPAFKVTGREHIRVDGAPVRRPEPTRLWRFHKPSGYVTTNRDPEGRRTIFELLPPELPRVVTIGRLDLTTEGLLLLTNDGELARALELPSTGLKRKYRARAFGETNQAQLDRLRDGIVYEDVEYRSIIARLERQVGANCWVDMTLIEGKKREARRALESIGLKVNRLIRTSYGPMTLDDLPEGALAEVESAELLACFADYIPAARRPDPSSRPRRRLYAAAPADAGRKPVRRGRDAIEPAGPNTSAAAGRPARARTGVRADKGAAEPAAKRSRPPRSRTPGGKRKGPALMTTKPTRPGGKGPRKPRG